LVQRRAAAIGMGVTLEGVICAKTMNRSNIYLAWAELIAVKEADPLPIPD